MRKAKPGLSERRKKSFEIRSFPSKEAFWENVENSRLSSVGSIPEGAKKESKTVPLAGKNKAIGMSGRNSGVPNRLRALGGKIQKGHLCFLSSTLSALLKKYDNQLHYALSAYNAGETPTKLWIQLRGHLEPMAWVESIPYPETRTYIKSILRNYAAYEMLYNIKASQFGEASESSN